jgi:hypothetical protein
VKVLLRIPVCILLAIEGISFPPGFAQQDDSAGLYPTDDALMKAARDGVRQGAATFVATHIFDDFLERAIPTQGE